jgi:hypothetical protein
MKQARLTQGQTGSSVREDETVCGIRRRRGPWHASFPLRSTGTRHPTCRRSPSLTWGP